MADANPHSPFDRSSMRLDRDGAQHVAGAASPMLGELDQAVSSLATQSAGTRLFGHAPLAPLLAPSGSLASLARSHLGDDARPVRALLFDKSAESNWSLAWHQDRVIAVRERRSVDGFVNWTIKSGVPHVSPPWALLSRMLTLRIHLDPVPPDNAPLLVAPGSHRLGLIPESAINATVQSCGIAQCLADAGDVWIYATPILHASDTTRCDRRRRELQLDYAALDLPGGLAWRGV